VDLSGPVGVEVLEGVRVVDVEELVLLVSYMRIRSPRGGLCPEPARAANAATTTAARASHSAQVIRLSQPISPS